jgi:hypothetical protein
MRKTKLNIHHNPPCRSQAGRNYFKHKEQSHA